jgi:hypothetical protein
MRLVARRGKDEGEMIDDEFKNRVMNYFYGFELADLLDIDSDEIVEAFPELIEENAELLEEAMRNGR